MKQLFFFFLCSSTLLRGMETNNNSAKPISINSEAHKFIGSIYDFSDPTLLVSDCNNLDRINLYNLNNSKTPLAIFNFTPPVELSESRISLNGSCCYFKKNPNSFHPPTASFITNETMGINFIIARFIDDNRLVGIDNNNTLMLYNRSNNTCSDIGELCEEESINNKCSIVVSEDYCAIVTQENAQDNSIILVDTEDKKIMRRFRATKLCALALHAPTKCIVLAYPLESRYAVEIKSWENNEKKQLLHSFPIFACCFTPEGYLITSTTKDKTSILYIWEMQTKRGIYSLYPLSSNPENRISFLSCTASLLCAIDNSSVICRLDWPTLRKTFEKNQTEKTTTNNNEN